MLLQQVHGETKWREIIAQLGKEDESFFVRELLKGILQFRYTGWEIFLFIEETDSSTDENDDDGILPPFQGVLCAEPCSYISKYVIYCTTISEAMVIKIKEKVNWSAPYCFMNVPNKLAPLLQTMGNRGTVMADPCFTYVLHGTSQLPAIPDGGTGTKNPEGVEIKELREEHAAIINANWKYAMDASEKSIAEELTCGKGYGVFVNGSIVSWIVRRNYGAMGTLHTRPEYRGRGYASHVVSTLSRDIFQRNMTPYVNIEKGNDIAVKLFEKLGFKKLQDVYFITYLLRK